MKKPLLNRAKTENDLTEMWDALTQLPPDYPGIVTAREQAMKTDTEQRAQLDLKDKVLPVLWEVANIINPDNPLQAALALNANAERLKTVIKAYSATI